MKITVDKCIDCGTYSEDLVIGVCVACEIDRTIVVEVEEPHQFIYNPEDETDMLGDDFESFGHPPMCSCRYCDDFDSDWELDYLYLY